MSGYRIEPVTMLKPRQRKPRVEKPQYLDLIRKLPCVVCHASPVEAAHIRTPSPRNGKRETGKSEKPSDLWTLPLCPDHHREQHQGDEFHFYDIRYIDPFRTALALWAAQGDLETMKSIVRLART
jgi:hypothetical protein